MRRMHFWCFLGIPLALAALPGIGLALTVAVRPVEVYNAPDLEAMAPGLQSVLASRLSGEGYQVSTSEKVESARADWSVKTTITRLGSVYSIDAAMEPAAASGEVVRAFQTANSMDAVLPALEAVAGKLRASIVRAAATPRTTAPTPAPAAAAPPPPPPPQAKPAPKPAAPPPSPPPEVVEVPKVPAPPAPSAERPAPATAQPAMDALLSQALRIHRQGPQLEGEARGVVVTDLDGDGTPEILVLMNDEIAAFHDQGGTISLLWKTDLHGRINALEVSAADIDGNGIPEVFVAGMDGTSPASQAYEWSGSALIPHGDAILAFVRAVVHPERGALLLGAEAGAARTLFARGIRSFSWSEGRYRPTGGVSAPEAAAPVNVDWLRLEEGKPPYGVCVTQGDRLRLYDNEGKFLFEGNDVVKGTTSIAIGEEDVALGMGGPRMKLQGRTVLWEAPGGARYLLLQRNYASVSRVFERIVSFSHGQMLAFRWDGLTLLNAAEGPKIPGYFSDIDIRIGRPPAGGGTTLYGVLVQKEGLIFAKVASRLLAYDLPTSER